MSQGKMKTIFFVRHGEILANREKRYAGWSDEQLTANGIKQAREAAQRLKTHDIRSIFTSPIKRAVQTAEIIGSELNLIPQMEPNLAELKMGHWEGRYEDDVAREFPDEWQIWLTRPADLSLPGRETLDELLDRALKGLERIEETQTDGAALAVTHVAIIRVLSLYYEKKDLNLYKNIDVPNASVFALKDGRFTLLLQNPSRRSADTLELEPP